MVSDVNARKTSLPATVASSMPRRVVASMLSGIGVETPVVVPDKMSLSIRLGPVVKISPSVT